MFVSRRRGPGVELLGAGWAGGELGGLAGTPAPRLGSVSGSP